MTLQPAKQGHFTLNIPVQGNQTPLILQAIDSKGRVKEENITIQYQGLGQTPSAARTPSWRFSPSLGTTHLSYTETNIAPFSAILVTPKLGITYALSEQWNLGASAFMNVASLSSSNPATLVRFTGLNARVAFSFAASHSPWKTSLMLGAYSLGMSVTPKTFGFDRLLGPQAMIAERKTLDDLNALTAYAKYSALMLQSGLSLSNRELAGGLSYERKLGGNFYTLAFDASIFDFAVEPVQSQSRTLSLSLGMGL
jgi:hypothetical protein